MFKLSCFVSLIHVEYLLQQTYWLNICLLTTYDYAICLAFWADVEIQNMKSKLQNSELEPWKKIEVNKSFEY